MKSETIKSFTYSELLTKWEASYKKQRELFAEADKFGIDPKVWPVLTLKACEQRDITDSYAMEIFERKGFKS